MIVNEYTTNEDGEILFIVDERIYLGVMEHLQSKSVSVNSKSTGDLIELCVLVSIHRLNQALADFPVPS